MSNQRSVMTEFRFLDQKRQAEGLTAEEASRYAQLRELVGPDTAGPARSGFDVNAAAARLRESLLPAGLRARPPEAAPPAPAAPPVAAPAPEPAPAVAALEQAWAEAPFADLSPAPADPLFDPGSLAQEVRPQAWNPEAPGYDPDAPYDEAAWIAAGYDPNATYDWSGHGGDAAGQPLPEGEPLAQEAAPQPTDAPPEGWDAAGSEAAPGWEAGLVEGAPEPFAAGGEAEPGPAAVEAPWEGDPLDAAPDVVSLPEPSPEAGWDVAVVEPEAAPVDAAAGQAAAPEAAPPEEPPLPFDPNAPFDHAKWFGRAADAPPAEAEPAPELVPAAPEAPPPGEPVGLEEVLDLDLGLADAADAPVFGEYDEAGAPLAAAPAGPEAPQPPEAGLGEVPAPEAGADLSSGWFDDAAPASHQPAPQDAPFGEYDEAGGPLAAAPPVEPGLEAMLPFDPAAASAIEPGAVPEGYEPGGPALDPAALPPVEPATGEGGAFDADQMYGGPEGDALPGGAPLELDASMPDWQPDAALEHGFELASDGSFGHAEAPVARTPAWGTAIPAVPAEGWESAPALDLAGPFEAPTLTPSQPVEAWAPPPPEPAIEELPTIDGAELLEELPPEALSPAAEPLGATEPPPAPLEDLVEGLEEAAPLEPPPVEPSPLVAGPLDVAPEPAWAEPEPLPAEAPVAAAGPASPAWEPEPAVSYEAPAAPADAGALPPEIAAAYGGATGDTFELPPAVADGLFDAAATPEPLEAEPLPPPAPSVVVEGSHRVVLHTVAGEVRRGLLVDALLDAPALALQPQGAGAVDEIPTDAIKAIFFMLAPGEKAPPPEGRKVRVTFRDGRQVAGFSPDYREGLVGFFMIPADTRTNTGRIWVYQGAVKQVTVS